MSLLDDFRRVDHRHICPVCEHSDWCLISRDNPDAPAKAVCGRVESRCRWGEAGWLHKLRDLTPQERHTVRRISIRTRQRDDAKLGDLHDRARNATTPERVASLAGALGVSGASLDRLEIGWFSETALQTADMRLGSGAWSFPMRDAADRLVGLRLRLPSGRKLAIRGSRNGLFVPRDFPESPERLVIAEGESDAAALRDLGFDVVGRPGCQQCTQLLVRLVGGCAPREVVIVSDNDTVGRRGAADLARHLRLYCAVVRVIAPPGSLKDAREWRRAGATRERVESVIAAAPAVALSMRTVGGRS